MICVLFDIGNIYSTLSWVYRFFSTFKMPFCCTTTQTWVHNIQMGAEYKQYTVQLKRRFRCFTEEYDLFVNGEKKEDHSLSYNVCSPFCCPGGEYEWEQDGHIFLLMYNSSLTLTTSFGEYRLFIDGIDVNTKREFSAFWRRRGWINIFMAVISVLIGLILTLGFRYVLGEGNKFSKAGYAFFALGALEFIFGLIPIFKFQQPRYPYRMPIEQTPNPV